MAEDWIHPCLRCGACCAFYRVQFYWRETEKDESNHYPVPKKLTESLDRYRNCMTGTNKKRNNRCVALTGRIGKEAKCSIYENRPSVCRVFPASYSDGKHQKRCDAARAAHGLKPLKPEDWK